MNDELDDILEKLYKHNMTEPIGYKGKYEKTVGEAKAELLKLIEERERLARVSELRQLEPPEQFKVFTLTMRGEHCKICGFNSEVFRKHIADRITQLSTQPTKEETE